MELTTLAAHEKSWFNQRSNMLVRDANQSHYESMDKIFVWVMVINWLAAIVTAVIVSPYTWIGAESLVHIHVWIAIGLGGCISSVPILLGLCCPGMPITRHVMAIGQALSGALLIHLTGGRIETHFHVFCSLAFVAFYHDWRVLVTMTVVVAADHAIRGIFFPLSVYGVVMESPYRWIEHAAWVVAEDFGLILACVGAQKKTRAVAETRARMELEREQVEDRIEERTKALRAKTEEAEKYAFVTKHTNSSVLILDENARVESVNDAFTRITGYSAEEVIGKFPLDVLGGPATTDEERAKLINGIKSQRPFTLSVHKHRKSGEVIIVNIEAQPVFDANGKLIRYFQVEEDITRAVREKEELQCLTDELKTTADHLRQQSYDLESARAHSERLLDSIDSILIQSDENGVVQRWNQSAERVFGLVAEEAVGRNFDRLPIQWVDFSPIASIIDSRGETPTCRAEVQFLSDDGTTRVISFAGFPVIEHGEFLGYLILGTDHTENRVMEQQLHNAQKLESVGQLAAGVAHEINTPMQYVGDNLNYVDSKFEKLVDYIDNALELIEVADQQGFESDRVAELQAKSKKLKLNKLVNQIPEALSDSIEGVGHVSRIVRAMKELSHPGSDEKSPVDINRSLETTMTVSTNEWKYVAEMETEFEEGLAMIDGFPGELNQVFLNLIVNSAHAISDMTDGGNNGMGKIILRSRSKGNFVRVEIQDTGGGIPQKARERVFDPFFTTKAVGKGTGQGLAIAHSVVVQKHGGKLAFEVEEGVGTTFIVELPMPAVPSP